MTKLSYKKSFIVHATLLICTTCRFFAADLAAEELDIAPLSMIGDTASEINIPTPDWNNKMEEYEFRMLSPSPETIGISNDGVQVLKAGRITKERSVNYVALLARPADDSHGIGERIGSLSVPGKIETGEDFVITDLGIELVWVEDIGSWVSKYEITNGQYRFFQPDHTSTAYENYDLDDDRQPVVYVSYSDTDSFSAWLTQRERQSGSLPDGWHYRLPTGDEWTQIAQVKDKRKYPWGNTWPPLYGNYDTDVHFDDYQTDSYADSWIVSCFVENSGCNEWGICGLAGNAVEWTSEPRSFEYVVRGASWHYFNMRTFECTYRSTYHPEMRSESLGFRLVLAKAGSQ